MSSATGSQTTATPAASLTAYLSPATTSASPSTEKQESKSWIAGAVIGPVAGCALVGALINNPADVRHDYHQEALVWYSRSLAALQRRINQGIADLTISMISCVLFIAIELFQGNKQLPLRYVNKGRNYWPARHPSRLLTTAFDCQ